MSFQANSFYMHALHRVTHRIHRASWWQRPLSEKQDRRLGLIDNAVMPSSFPRSNLIADFVDLDCHVFLVGMILIFPFFMTMIFSTGNMTLALEVVLGFGLLVDLVMVGITYLQNRARLSKENIERFNQIAVAHPELLESMMTFVGEGGLIRGRALAYFLWAEKKLKRAELYDKRLNTFSHQFQFKIESLSYSNLKKRYQLLEKMNQSAAKKLTKQSIQQQSSKGWIDADEAQNVNAISEALKAKYEKEKLNAALPSAPTSIPSKRL